MWIVYNDKICQYISFSAGYGLSALVNKINKHRAGEMDIYLVGCANVGKSTLYNLLSNLLTVHKNDRMPPQAIEHHLPGTTASLLREGIGMHKLKKLEWRLKNGPWEVSSFLCQNNYGILDHSHLRGHSQRTSG